MKIIKLILLLFIISATSKSFGQITFLGDILNPSTVSYSDPGSQSYSGSRFSVSVGTVAIVVFRHNGYWYKIEYIVGINIPNIRRRTELQHFTVDPPCTTNWYFSDGSTTVWNFGISTPYSSVISPPVFSSSLTSNIETMTGTCTPGSFRSVSLTPSFISLPTLSTSEIMAIVSPPAGSIVWDSTAMCLKVYNGTSWVCL